MGIELMQIYFILMLNKIICKNRRKIVKIMNESGIIIFFSNYKQFNSFLFPNKQNYKTKSKFLLVSDSEMRRLLIIAIILFFNQVFAQ